MVKKKAKAKAAWYQPASDWLADACPICMCQAWWNACASKVLVDWSLRLHELLYWY